MTELSRPAAPEAAPLGYSEILKTQAEQRAELRRMRTIATMLLVLMSAIFLATAVRPRGAGSGRPISARSRKPAWWGHAPTGSRSSRSSAVRSGCRFPIRPSCRRTRSGSGRRSDASSPTTFSLRASRWRGLPRLTPSALRRDGWRMSATRRRSRPAPGALVPYALDLLPRAAFAEWVGNGGAARDRGGPRRAAGRARACRFSGRRAPARRCSTRASISPRRRSRATRRRSSNMSRSGPRALSPSGSTTCSPPK